MAQSVYVEWNGAAANAAVRAAAARGLSMAAEELRSLALPLTPYLTGDLSRSAQVHPADTGELAARVTYDTPYAVIQHEALGYSHTRDPNPQAQAKYLEGPLRDNQTALSQVVGQTIEGAL